MNIAMEETVCQNTWELFKLLAGTSPYELIEEHGMKLRFDNMPNLPFNGVYSTKQTSEGLAFQIERVKALYEQRELPLYWRVWSTDTPLDLQSLLNASGFVLVAEVPGMILKLDELSYDEVTSNDFIINPVQTQDDLNIWRDIAIAVNGPAFVPLADTYVRVGIGNQLHSYIGWIEDVPVAISSIFYGTYAAGVYNISTLPAYRGRGLGRAITLRGLQDAKENKYEVAVLTSTEMGLPVYNRIGSKPCTTMSVYKHMQSIANS
jgi:GNAT superfamily N-acetyltransferase